MTQYHRNLEEKAKEINEIGFLTYEIHVNRRNGYYAIDMYDRVNGNYMGYFDAGYNYKECKKALWLILNTFFFMKTF